MKIYTKTGDKGQTSLYDGTRVDKDSIRVESYGTIDELNSYIGLCMHYINEDEKKVLFNIQRDLFYIGSELATKNTEKLNKVVTDNDIKNLENIIDKYMGEAKGIDSFIIPFHCFRLVQLSDKKEVKQQSGFRYRFQYSIFPQIFL